MRKLNHWDERYLGLAEYVSNWSKDPSTKVGAVVVSPDNTVVSVGFNGFPRGVEDSESRLNDRNLKYKMVVHAEKNAIVFANRSVRLCTLYTYPFMPCSSCAAFIIQAGILEVIAPYCDNPRWNDNFLISQNMFEEANVGLTLANIPE